jgi:Icc-related predicted phosphoesterase
VIRIAAVGDVHIGPDSVGHFAPGLAGIEDHADVLLLAGDLTKCGTPDEARLVVDELRDVPVPIVAVLGNHDHHSDQPAAVTAVLERHGIRVLEGEHHVVDLDGGRLGIAGAKGFGGGFAPAAATAFGEPELKAFVRHTHHVAERLTGALDRLDREACDGRVVLLHYAPVLDTLVGERPELFAFLGSQLLGEAVDCAQVDLALHGHAHGGCEHGTTPGGVPVRNVAMPVLGCAYRVYCIDPSATRGVGGRHARA